MEGGREDLALLLSPLLVVGAGHLAALLATEADERSAWLRVALVQWGLNAGVSGLDAAAGQRRAWRRSKMPAWTWTWIVGVALRHFPMAGILALTSGWWRGFLRFSRRCWSLCS